jgi:hypothetical protein
MKKEDLFIGGKYYRNGLYVCYYGLQFSNGNPVPILLWCHKNENIDIEDPKYHHRVVGGVSLNQFLENWKPYNPQNEALKEFKKSENSVNIDKSRRSVIYSGTGFLELSEPIQITELKETLKEVTEQALIKGDYNLLTELRNIFDRTVEVTANGVEYKKSKTK